MIIGTVRMQINGQWCDVTGSCLDPRNEAVIPEPEAKVVITESRLREILAEHRIQTIEFIIEGIQRGKFR
jgi:hypothetical protein